MLAALELLISGALGPDVIMTANEQAQYEAEEAAILASQPNGEE